VFAVTQVKALEATFDLKLHSAAKARTKMISHRISLGAAFTFSVTMIGTTMPTKLPILEKRQLPTRYILFRNGNSTGLS
jgi:hypothetical protein